jgi:hypothetical protein
MDSLAKLKNLYFLRTSPELFQDSFSIEPKFLS